MQEEVGRWWKQAEYDFETAKANFEIKRFSVTALFCQQAVEKALKAILIKRKRSFPKIHDLVALGNEIGLPQELLQKAKELTMAYIYSRYPDTSTVRNEKQISEDFLKYGEKILKWAKTQL